MFKNLDSNLLELFRDEAVSQVNAVSVCTRYSTKFEIQLNNVWIKL